MLRFRTTERDTELHEIVITESRLTSPTNVTWMGIDAIAESSILPYLMTVESSMCQCVSKSIGDLT